MSAHGKRWPLLCGMTLILCMACASAPEPSAVPSAQPPVVFGDAGHAVPRLAQSNPGDNDGDFRIRLRRGPCLGRCPVYELTIHADGRVDYVGHCDVAVVGTRQARADPEKLAALRARLEQPQTAALAGEYVRSTPACGVWTSDQPVVALDVALAGRRWHITHDWGCRAAPAALRNLEQAVDDAADASQWIAGPTR